MGDVERKEVALYVELEERVRALEAGRKREVELWLPWRRGVFLAIVLGVFSVLCLVPGVGLPNDFYQVLFAVLLLGVAYHRGWLRRPENSVEWGVVFFNFVMMMLLLKLVIGGGSPQPFSWLRWPNISFVPGSEKFFEVMPQVSVVWERAGVADFRLPITVVQTFFFVLVLAAASLGLEIFASLLGFVLVLASIPVLLTFEWSWVLPGIVLAWAGFYVQVHTSVKPRIQQKRM